MLDLPKDYIVDVWVDLLNKLRVTCSVKLTEFRSAHVGIWGWPGPNEMQQYGSSFKNGET